jgi:hypothetical protein
VRGLRTNRVWRPSTDGPLELDLQPRAEADCDEQGLLLAAGMRCSVGVEYKTRMDAN